MLLKDRVAIVSGIGPGMGRDISLGLRARGRRRRAGGARRGQAGRGRGRRAGARPARASCVPTDIAQRRGLPAAGRRGAGRVRPHRRAGQQRLQGRRRAAHGRRRPRRMAQDLRRQRLRLAAAHTGGRSRTCAARGGGSIVFINSMSMRIIEPQFGGYAASKGALMIAAQTLAQGARPRQDPRQLRRARLHLGPGAAGLLQDRSPSSRASRRRRLRARSRRAPRSNHIPDSEEIADAVVFFASDLSRVVTGQALDVNGGHFFH